MLAATYPATCYTAYCHNPSALTHEINIPSLHSSPKYLQKRHAADQMSYRLHLYSMLHGGAAQFALAPTAAITQRSGVLAAVF